MIHQIFGIYQHMNELANDMKDWEFTNRNRNAVRRRPRNINRTGGYCYKLPPKKYPNAERNKPCPCGSGLKFKKCCVDTYEDKKEET